MAKSPSEQIAGFLLDFLPSLLPKPVDAVTKSAIGSFRDQLDNFLNQPRLHGELLDATQKAESNFRFEARRQLKSDELIQAVTSFPLFDNDLFQKALASLPEHLDEEFLAHDLKKIIDDDWRGKFTPAELREGVGIYLNCLRIQLLNVEGFGDIVTKLATLRTDMRTERIDERTARIESKIDFISEIIQPQTAYSQAVKIDPTVPRTLPDFYVSREELLKQIKAALGMDVGMGGGRTVAITALLGIGGVGKTILAQAVANDSDLRVTFPDGLLWASLGPDARDIESADPYLSDWLIALQTDPRQFPNPTNKAEEVRKQLSEQKRLLIIDDIWFEEAATLFLSVRTNQCALLLTSRDRELMTRLGVGKNNRIDVDALTEVEARMLVGNISGEVADKVWENSIKPVMTRLGWHALAVQLAAKQVSLDDTWDRILAALIQVQGTERLDFDDPKIREQSLFLTFKISTDILDELTQKRFSWLGALAPSDPFYSQDAAWIWTGINIHKVKSFHDELNVSLENAQKTLSYLTRRGLLEVEQVDGEQMRYRMHLLLWEHAHRLLRKSGEQELALRHHSQSYAKVVETDDDSASERRNTDLSRSQWRSLLERAWVTYTKGKGLKLPDPDLARIIIIQLAISLAEYWDMRSLMAEWILWGTRAAQVCQEIGERQAEATQIGNLGVAYANLGDTHKAIELNEQVLTIAREFGDRRTEGAILDNLGAAYKDLGKTSKAIEYYEQAMAIARETDNHRGEGNALSNLGEAYLSLGETTKAIETYQQALLIDRKFGDRRGELVDLARLGNAYQNLKEFPKAIKLYEQALEISRSIGDLRAEGKILSGLGAAHDNVGETLKAIELYEQGLAIDREIVNRYTHDMNLSDLVIKYQRRGEILDLGRLGVAHQKIGDIQKAIVFYEKTLLIAREIADRHNECIYLSKLGMAHADLQDFQKAIEFYQQSLVIAHEVGDREWEYVNLEGLGNVYANIGKVHMAFTCYEKGLMISQEIHNRPNEGIFLSKLGWCCLLLGEALKGIYFYDQALNIHKELNNQQWEMFDLHGLGKSFEALKEIHKAISRFEQAWVIAHEIGDPINEIQLIQELGNSYLELKNYEQALALFEQAAQTAKSISPEEEASVMNLFAGVFEKQKNYSKAIEYYSKAIETSPNSAYIWRNRAHLHILSKNAHNASNDLDEASKIEPNDAFLFLRRGELATLLENFADAVENFKVALNLNNRMSDAYFGIGIAFLHLKKTDEALGAYRHGAETIESLNDLEGAIEELEQLHLEQPLLEGIDEALKLLREFSKK